MQGLKRAALTLATAGLLSSGVAQAALFARGGGLIYDSDLNITWLADANYAKTSGYDADGLMSWTAANTWAANLTYGGYSDWRLPTALNQDASGPCSGYNCTGSELGYMFYKNLGATAGTSVLLGTNTANLALFTNLQTYAYWSGTVYAPSPAYYAWYFLTHNGLQYGTGDKGGELYAWAVRPGDVAAVPEPETYAMLLAGLGVLGFAARRRKQNAA